MYSGSRLLADLNFQSVRELHTNFTIVSVSEFKFLIILIGGKMSKKTLRPGKPFLFRKVFTDAAFLGKW